MHDTDQARFVDDVVDAANRIDFEDMMQSSRRAQDFGGPPVVDAESEKARAEAEALSRSKTVLDHLCPALQSASSDLGSIAKVVGATLFTLSLSPAAPVSFTVLAVGALAVLITRAGTKGLCSGHMEQK